MPLDIRALISAHAGEASALYEAHVNPRLAKALRLIGFDRCYVKGSGPYLWDSNGRRYLDMLAGYGVFNTGRNHPAIRQALIDFMMADAASLVQMETPVLCGLLARELKRRCERDLERVYFCSTGAEATETAMKFARRATGRSRILYASRAFHGLTTGALSVNGCDVFRDGFGPLPFASQVPFGDPEALEAALSEGDVAAFIVEPVQGKGVRIPPPGYLAEASRLCRHHGALLICDEVQCGMGRTGRFLALHHDGAVQPDMILLSKALSGGYVPLAAVLMQRSIFDAVFTSVDRAVVHSSTFGKSSFAMAAGLATLSVMEDEDLTGNAARLGDRLGKGLVAIAARHEFIQDVRWRGLMLGIEFGRPRSLKLRTAWNAVSALNEDLFCQAVTIPLLEDHGILTQVAGNRMSTIKLTPPLIITAADVDAFLGAFDTVMSGLHGFPGPAWESLFRIGRNVLSSNSSPNRKATA
jgi:ornithine--oxo-acid transaminase